MLLILFRYLVTYENSFYAFTYLSSRAILALLTGILITLFFYPGYIRRLKALKVGQPIRKLGPESHYSKQGTPTMGGLLIVISTLISALLWMEITSIHFFTLSFVTITFCLIGARDDFLKVTKKSSDGLSSRKKFLWLAFFSAVAIAWHSYANNHLVPQWVSNKPTTLILFPFFKNLVVDFSWFYFPFAVLVLVGSSNAVNLTDGMDGLAIGPVIMCSIALAVLSYVNGNIIFAKYLNYHSVFQAGEISVFLCGLIGAAIGFLWYNTWPAQVFMGDSGALPLGGVLGLVSVITSHELLLVVMGGVFVVEALSVILQVASFKATGKRIFKMAPLHHHYEKLGWPEQKITVRAWVISFMLALLSILTLKLR